MRTKLMRPEIIHTSWAAILTGLLAGIWLLTGCRPPAPAEEASPVAVKAAVVQREEIASESRYSASVVEFKRVELSFKVAGTVVSLLQVAGAGGRLRDVQEGDEVHAGDVLAELDRADYQRALDIAKEQLAQAERQYAAAAATAEMAEKDFERLQTLFKQQSVSKQQFDQATTQRNARRAAAEAAQRQVAQARLAVQQAESDLESCRLMVSGMPTARVAAQLVEPNERVAPMRSAFVLIDVSRVRVVFGVPDTMVGDRRLGEVLPVTAEALSGRRFDGRVTKIAPTADPGTRTFPVELTIDQPGDLRPGMIVTIGIGKRSEGILVSMTAVQRGKTAEQFAVFQVVEEEGRTRVRKRAVELLGVYDNRVLVEPDGKTEIAGGDRIVVVGASRLQDGEEVHTIEEEPDDRAHIAL